MSDATPTPTIAQKAPYPIEVEAGRSYWWCTCGNSKKQPFCDGSHKGGAFSPLQYTAASDGRVWFCGCKATGKAPLCDGKHKAL
jgi:CDGSH iron-sulfur domain-containing protein 3